MKAPARRQRTKFEAPLTVAALLTFRSVSSVLLIWRLVNYGEVSSNDIFLGLTANMLEVVKLTMNCKMSIADMCFHWCELLCVGYGRGYFLLTILVMSVTPYPAVPIDVTMSRLYAAFSRTISMGKSDMSSPL